MIPIQDNIPARRYPLVMAATIAACVAVFVYQLSLPPGSLKAFVMSFGVVPRDFDRSGGLIAGALRGEAVPLLASMFLHGGWLHLVGNMWYLWIFGDNVEDRMGHARFLFFYVLAGVVASVVHVLMNPGSPMPAVGASGAIAGVLGAYLVAFPLARVVTLVPIFMFVQFVELPAILLLGFWFLMQTFSGVASLSMPEQGGVAWWAHIGGFLFGVVFGPLLMRGARPEPGGWEPRRRYDGWSPNTRHSRRID